MHAYQLFLTLTFATAFVFADNVVYVSPDGDDSADGKSWATAWRTPQKAIDWSAEANADTAPSIYLGEGVFTGAQKILNITNAVEVIGAGIGKTVFMPDNQSADCTVAISNSAAVLRGVTITGNTRDWAVKVFSADSCIEQCCVGTNSAGGVYIAAPAVVSRSLIAANSGRERGGGIFFANPAYAGTFAKVDNTVFDGNIATTEGGATACYYNGRYNFYFCTFVNNRAPQGAACSERYGSNAGLYVYNCIFYENRSSTSLALSDFSSVYAEFRIYNSYTFDGRGTDPVSERLNFASYETGDFRLRFSSSCRDAGREVAGYDQDTLDYYGNSRLSGSAYDIGAYEWNSDTLVCDFVSDKTSMVTGEKVTFTAEVSQSGDYFYRWTVYESDGETVHATGTGAIWESVLTANGPLKVRLEVADASSGTVLVTAVVPGAVNVSPSVTYVASNSSGPVIGVYPYDTPAKATSDIVAAIDAVAPGGRVIVTGGVLKLDGTLNVLKDVEISGEGGWPTNTLTLSDDAGKVRVLFINNPNAKVSGFTISGGRCQGDWQKGLAVSIGENGGTLSNCRLTGNVFKSTMVYGVVAVLGDSGSGGKGLVENCIIDGNKYSPFTYYSSGGAVLMEGGILRNTLIYGNEGCQTGGVIVNGAAKVQNCTIVSNVVKTAAENGNFRTGGGGVCFCSASADCVFENNLIAFNCDTQGASDFGIAGTSTPAVTNIVAATVRNCLFADSRAAGLDPVVGDPRFVGPVDSALGDFTLKATWSNPGYKAGLYDEWMDGAVELYGRARIRHTGSRGQSYVDIGCAESPWRFTRTMVIIH